VKSWKKCKYVLQKRIPALKYLTYCQRLARLRLDSLELRRVCSNLIFTYKLVFGLTDLKLTDYFLLHSDTRSRRHQYKLFFRLHFYGFFAYRAARIWNGLPEDSINISSLSVFKRSLSSIFLVRYCKVYFF